MYQKEKRIIATLFITFLILGFYVLYVYNKFVVDNPEIINDLKFWGKSFLILLPVMIISQIILHIVFFILAKIITREEISTITDEMDKIIDLKSLKVFNWVNGIGFTLAMGALAMEMHIWVFFITLLSSGFIAMIVSSIAKIYYYRKGV